MVLEISFKCRQCSNGRDQKSSKNLSHNFFSSADDVDKPIDSQTCKQKMRMNYEELLRAAKWKVSPCKQRSLSMFNWNFRNNPGIPNFLWLKSETNLFVNNISDLHWLLEIEWQISTKVSLRKQGTHGATKLASIVDRCKIVQTFEFIIISWFRKIYRKRIQLLPWTAEMKWSSSNNHSLQPGCSN